MLTPEQRAVVLTIAREYESAHTADKDSWLQHSADLDRNRRELIDRTLKPLVTEFLGGRIPLDRFKTQVDGINKRNELWGFKGIKGQMFFNQMVNVCDDEDELAAELVSAMTVPESKDIARSRIRTFAQFVKRMGEVHIERGGTPPQCPKATSVPYFLSYFWQLQARDSWSVYYTNSVRVAQDLNLWRETGELAEDYLSFCELHDELRGVLSREMKRPYTLYDVEHVFWFKGNGQKQSTEGIDASDHEKPDVTTTEVINVSADGRLPDSFVPPIVSVLSVLARGGEEMEKAAKASGTSAERAFEKCVNAAFTMLGYETKLLGQGQGRVPDGLAIDHDHSYAIIWDAKIRSSRYSIGTDDRAIREYIVTQSRELKRRKSLRNVYYAIVSSTFSDDHDDTVRSIKMETDVNEVCLIEAGSLVALVEQKVRDPRAVSLGPDGIQRVFSSSGVLSASTVAKLFA